tara:strand:+ start:1000 stop:1383 length:384 start_codon:yes stop_codon:yes gene_type:complete
MIRWHLIFREKNSNQERNPKIPFNVYYHKILRSDEPVLHDHPWYWGTFIISGGYWEHTPEGTTWCGPGSWRTKTPDDQHWLELKDGAPCHTLFWHGKRRKTWGFQTADGWVPYRTFLENRAKSIAYE